MIDVVRDVLARVPGPDDEIILLVQPTQPLREPKHLTEAIRLMENDAGSVVSVTETTQPEKSYRIESGILTPVSLDGTIERRQDMPLAYRRDGTVYSWRRGKRYFDTYATPLVIPKSETCELDTPDDWAIAEVRLAAKEALIRA